MKNLTQQKPLFFLKSVALTFAKVCFSITQSSTPHVKKTALVKSRGVLTPLVVLTAPGRDWVKRCEALYAHALLLKGGRDK